VTVPTGRLGRLLVHPRSPHARHDEPLTAGVPLPRGRLADHARLAVVDSGGRPCPAAARVLERWSDGTIRWALVDVVANVPAHGTSLDVLEGVPTAHSTPLEVRCDGTTAEVSSGGFRARFDVTTPHGLTELAVHGQPVTGGFAWRLRDATGDACTVSWAEVTVDGASPLAATVTLRGTVTTPSRRILQLSAALRFFAGQTALGVDVELHNPSRAVHTGGYWELGDAGSVLLRSAAVAVASMPLGGPHRLRARIDRGEFEECQVPFDLTQHSSGGEHWRSPVHVDASGTPPFDHRGYVLRSGVSQRLGLRAEPTLVVGAPPAGELSVTAPAFWQVFPKAVTVSAAGDVEVAWLPAGLRPHEIQGGERCHFEFAIGVGPDLVTSAPLEWRRAASVVLPDPDTAAAAGAIPRMIPAAVASPQAYDALVAAALDGDDTFAAKREHVDEYGWRHFGDLYADHENGADPSVTRVSHYNNQYDAVAGLITQALRSGDPRWWLLADDLARHVARIDIYWTDEDKAAYNGGLFWHTTHYVDAGRSTHRTYPQAPGVGGGGPSNEHCYTTGLLLHYLLTGTALSALAVERLARWMIDADDGAKAPVPLRWLSRARTGYASSTNSPDYHGPGRGAANAVVAMLNATRLTGVPAYLDKAHELVGRVVHPEDDIASLSLDEPERRWSYTVMLQALGRYADDLAERGGHAPAEAYARAVIGRYARWMAAHEYPYLDRPERLEYPTETWAAHDLRKTEVFDLAAEQCSDPVERERFVERARFFYQTALRTLAAMPTRTRTRPMVLLLSNGFARAWHEARSEAPPPASASGPWPPRTVFVPQRVVATKRILIATAAATAILVLALVVALAG
jgi:hypothetical protein